jgi:Notch-like protein
MDKTGETSLHLAARYARADASKRLLDAGADANSQDNTGRTPLHAAVAADAMGVFQVSGCGHLSLRREDRTQIVIVYSGPAVAQKVQ